MSTTTAIPAVYGCPDWCTEAGNGHEWGIRGSDGTPACSHDGPRFGEFISVGAETTLAGPEQPDACHDGVGSMTAVGLRKLAADALAAAEWLEAHATA